REIAEIEALGRALVDADHGHPARQQKPRRGSPGQAHAVDHHAAEAAGTPGNRERAGHRSLSVERLSSAKSRDKIQKRTMILGSAQPASSKWWWERGIFTNTLTVR